MGNRQRLKSLVILSALILALVTTILSESASAADISYVSINGTWHDPVDNLPGSQPGEPVITNGVPTSSINWGVTSGSQSGYDFTGTIPPPQTLPGPSPLFPLGTFTHRNFEVSSPSLTSVQLDVVLVLSVDGVQTAPLNFTFTFNHEETPNNATPCPYPTPPGEGCTDRVTFVSAPQPTTFNVGGVDYTLAMSFLDVNGNPVSEFITRENGTINTSGLVGQFILPPVPPAGPALVKATTQPTATIGEAFKYRITVPAAPYSTPLYDVRILDDLTASAADLEYVAVTKVSGSGAWSPTNTGTNTNLIIEDNGAGIDIPAGEQVEIEVTVRLQDTATNVAGLAFTNAASSTFNQQNNDGASQRPGTLGTSGAMTIVEPRLTLQKTGPTRMRPSIPGTFRLNVHNAGLARAFAPTIIDRLPSAATASTCNAAPTLVTAQVFQADGVTPVAPALIAGTDYTFAFAPAPDCTLTLNMLTSAASVGPNQRLIVSYATLLDATSQLDAILTNVAGVTDWYGFDTSTPGDQGRHYARVVTDGTPGVLDHQDAFSTNGQALTITKQVSVVGGGAAIAGATLEYLVTVRNDAMVPATGVYVMDDLDEALPGQLLYVDQSALLNGTANGISVAGPVITANYSSVYGPLAPGQSFELRFRAQLYPNLAIGTPVKNVAHVTWNTDQTAYAEVSIDVGGMVGSGILNGTVWHDADFDNVLDANERVLEGWTVELRRNDELSATATTDAAGVYQIAGLVPNYQTQDRYDLTFRAPGAGANTALLGLADSGFRNALQRIYDIQVQANSNLQNLNLPIDPDGVVYNSLSRAPLSGVNLRLVEANTHNALPANCFDDPNQQGQVTRIDGYYKFDINFSDPSCPSGGSYAIDVVPPTPGYEAGVSRVIPPPDVATPPFNVLTCPASADDAIPSTTDFCEMQASEFAPAASIPAQSRGTAYRLRVVLENSRVPGASQLYNNHLPVDPTLTGVVTISKTTPMVNVMRGQMVPYVISVKNTWEFPLTDVDVVDRYPVGFKYVEGSARFDDQPLEPTVADGRLVWSRLTLAAKGEHTIKLLLAPGAGVTEGKFTNFAHAQHNLTGQALSGQASATVRIVPDPTFDCTDVTGKVFDDHNRNGIQEEGETGIAGARLVSPTGLAALTDSYGRFHITCAITPREGRGSNFMLKLDNRSLPTGYRGSTDAFQIQRATRGKALHFSFGASIHKVIGLDIADAVFVPDSTEMRPQWRPRVNLLLEELQKGPAVLRLSYLADVEDPQARRATRPGDDATRLDRVG